MGWDIPNGVPKLNEEASHLDRVAGKFGLGPEAKDTEDLPRHHNVILENYM